VDNEREVASVFGIQSIPSVLFVPVNGQPQMSVGAMQKEGYVNAIEQVFGIK
jgi:thioredoxin-like negative regulator of GroEL